MGRVALVQDGTRRSTENPQVVDDAYALLLNRYAVLVSVAWR